MTLNQKYYTALSVHMTIKGFSEVSGLSMAEIGEKIAHQIATMPDEQREMLAREALLDMQNLYQMHVNIMGNNA